MKISWKIAMLLNILTSIAMAQSVERTIDLDVKWTPVHQDLGIGVLDKELKVKDAFAKCHLRITVTPINFDLTAVEQKYSDDKTTTTLNAKEKIDYSAFCDEFPFLDLRPYLSKPSILRGHHRKVWEKIFFGPEKKTIVLNDEFGCWVESDVLAGGWDLSSRLQKKFEIDHHVQSCAEIPLDLNGSLTFMRKDGVGYLTLENGQISGSSGSGVFSGTYQIK